MKILIEFDCPPTKITYWLGMFKDFIHSSLGPGFDKPELVRIELLPEPPQLAEQSNGDATKEAIA